MENSFLLKALNNFLNNLPRLGIILLTVFLIDQIKLEFLRFRLTDFQHFIFMLFGAFLAFSDKLRNLKSGTNYKVQL